MPDQRPITTTIEGGIATITLSSPGNANAMTLAWGHAFKDAIASLTAADGLRVVHLRAEGKAFCVGGDISAFADTDDPRGLLIHLAGDLHDGILALLALDAPLVVSVQGVAAGAGLSLVCAADIAIAGRSAAFIAAYTGAGLSPDGGMSWTLPRLIGTRRATEMILTNRLVGAEEAAAIGLVTETVDDDQLGARADEVISKLAALSPSSLGATRRLIHQGAVDTLETHLPREAMSIADLAASPSGQEGITAFLEKRKPVFES
jgi:2-(1,2-epoxy-1,2-dihydrophenyl)acetyl-CoA isomerase